MQRTYHLPGGLTFTEDEDVFGDNETYDDVSQQVNPIEPDVGMPLGRDDYVQMLAQSIVSINDPVLLEGYVPDRAQSIVCPQ